MRSATPLLGLMRTAALIGLVLVLAACGRNGTGVGNLGPGGGPPGSQQEFLVTVGDRVFFETDSSSLTSTAPRMAASRGRSGGRSAIAPLSRDLEVEVRRLERDHQAQPDRQQHLDAAR